MPTNLVLTGHDEHPQSLAVSVRAATELTPRNAALHRNFEQSARDLQRDIVRVVYYLERICHHRIHATLGFRRIEDYAAAVAGYSPSQTQRLLRMGRRLYRYPEVARALGSGGLSFAKAMLICTHATPQQQRDMVEAARALTVRQLRLRLIGSESPAVDNDVAGRELVDGIERGEVVEIDQAMGAGPEDDRRGNGMAGGAIAVSVSEAGDAEGGTAIGPDSCGTVPAQSDGQPRPDPQPARRAFIPGAARTADDPGHYITLRLNAEQWQRWNSIMDHERRRTSQAPVDILLAGLASLRDEPTSGASGIPYLVVMIACPKCGGVYQPTRKGEVTTPPALIAAAACDAIHEDDVGNRQSVVPPRQRRLALQRARYRCEAPRCRQTRMLEIHHRRPAAAGGTHELDNLLVLCWRCHRRLHEADLAAAKSLKQAPA